MVSLSETFVDHLVLFQREQTAPRRVIFESLAAHHLVTESNSPIF
jgi:hypothetical protein